MGWKGSRQGLDSLPGQAFTAKVKFKNPESLLYEGLGLDT